MLMKKNGQMEKVLNLVEQMKQNEVKPTEITWIVIISACAEVAALDLGRKYHKEIINRKIKPNIILETSLINMYSKSGSLEEAEIIFNNMKFKNVVTYRHAFYFFVTKPCCFISLISFRTASISF